MFYADCINRCQFYKAGSSSKTMKLKGVSKKLPWRYDCAHSCESPLFSGVVRSQGLCPIGRYSGEEPLRHPRMDRDGLVRHAIRRSEIGGLKSEGGRLLSSVFCLLTWPVHRAMLCEKLLWPFSFRGADRPVRAFQGAIVPLIAVSLSGTSKSLPNIRL